MPNLEKKTRECTSETRCQKEEDKYVEVLIELLYEYEDSIGIMQDIKEQYRKLETQNNYLKSENQEYRRKISLITDTLPGKMGIYIYRKIKQIKVKFNRK